MEQAEIGKPAQGSSALLIIDMLNRMDFEGAEPLRARAEAVSHSIAGLRDEAERLEVPIVYVNDNFGQWHSERARLVEHCVGEDSPTAGIVERVAPRQNDFFVIKPQFSGFYATNLPVLLPELGASRLILTGVAADVCILFTAADAHMRKYDLWIPSDTTASDNAQRTEWALEIMKNSMDAETRPTSELSLKDWLDSADSSRHPAAV